MTAPSVQGKMVQGKIIWFVGRFRATANTLGNIFLIAFPGIISWRPVYRALQHNLRIRKWRSRQIKEGPPDYVFLNIELVPYGTMQITALPPENLR